MGSARRATTPAALNIATPIYFSPELATAGAGITRERAIASVAGLLGLALTTNPAGHGLRPISMRAGDVRRASSRAARPINWRSADPLLGRCLDTPGSRPRAPRLVVRNATHAAGWVDYDGRPCAAPVRGATGRILSVR